MSAVPFSYRQYAGNGSTTSFSVPFPYLLKSHVKVYIGFNILDGTYSSELADGTGFTWSSGTQIQCATAPASGQTLTVIRVTPNTTRLVDWQDGSNLISNDLDTADLQNLYVIQEQQDRNDAGITQSTAAQVAAAAATTASTTATTTANTALSTANTALSTANTASSNASAAVSTANTASTNASAAVATANTASTNASAAVSTANTASSNASSAVATANSAVSTANSAATAASSAVTTANNANTTAQAANTTATNAESIANSALSIVAGTVQFVPVANVAAVPGSPSNDDAIQVQDSTGIESFSPLTGLPAGFTGTPQLFVRIQYDTPGSTWQYVGYGANDPDNRYVIQGVLGTANNPSFYFDPDTGIYSPGADELGLSTGGAARLTIDSAGNVAIPGTLGVTGAITGSLTGAASLNVLKTGDTMTGSLTATALIPSGSTVPTNGVYLPAANSVAISTNGANRIDINSGGVISHKIYDRWEQNDGSSVAGYIGNANLVLSSGSQADFALRSQANVVFAAGGGTERMRLDSAGRLGIGSSSPVATNHIRGSGTSGQVTASWILENFSSGAVGMDVTGAAGSSIWRFLYTGSGPQTGTNTFNTALSIGVEGSAAGRVGIGDTGPDSTLTIKAAAATTPLKVSGPTSEFLRCDQQGRLLVGTSSASDASKFVVQGQVGANAAQMSVRRNAVGADSAILGSIDFDDSSASLGARIQAVGDAAWGTNDYPTRLVFSTTADGASSPTEAMRINSERDVLIGTTTGFASTSSTATGHRITAAGAALHYISSTTALFVGRQSNDGTLVSLRQDGVEEGTISVSGTTVSYNGAHLSRWSQLPSGAERTEILRGSVLSNIDEMCEWGEEDNEQLNRMKVSDVEGDKNVSGVFQAWDDDDDTYTNDFYCAMTGDFIIRIAGGVTVERGDLLMSAGDGTAKPQDDDIIRSKTIAKVTSTNVSCTYADGSYCVPCVLMAC